MSIQDTAPCSYAMTQRSSGSALLSATSCSKQRRIQENWNGPRQQEWLMEKRWLMILFWSLSKDVMSQRAIIETWWWKPYKPWKGSMRSRFQDNKDSSINACKRIRPTNYRPPKMSWCSMLISSLTHKLSSSLWRRRKLNRRQGVKKFLGLPKIK